MKVSHRVFQEYVDLAEAALECANDLAAEVEARYAGVKDHPAMAGKYERDLESARRVWALLLPGGGTGG